MSGFTDSVVTDLWDQAVLQLDAYTHSRIIKLSGASFNALGERGEQYFKQQASLLLNGQAEFHIDASNNNRFYLGISTEFVQQFGFTIQQSQGHRLPALFPPSVQSIVCSPVSQSTSSSGYSTPTFQIPSSEFNFGTPTPAPRYPLSSPIQLGTVQPTAGPSSASKRSIEMVNASNGQPNQGWSPLNTPSQSSSDGASDGYREDGGNDDEHDDEKPHVKRPPNSWILFRQANHSIIMKKYPKIHNSEVSKIISAIWKGMSKAEKKPWVDLAAAKAVEHKLLHPGYKYKPSLKKSKTSAKRAKTNDQPVLADPIEFLNMDAFQNAATKNLADQSFAPQSSPDQTGPNGTKNADSQNIIDQVLALKLTPDQLGLGNNGAQSDEGQNPLNQAFIPQIIPDQTGLNHNDPQNSLCLPQMGQQEPLQYQPGEFSDAMLFPQGDDEFINQFETQFMNFN
ncbi:hypothetical protein GGR58DRAFT_502091 [Xylaria digitata]|nr:hypothetical protein GGR58DRAFT_502091 [Xylaria digitata]